MRRRLRELRARHRRHGRVEHADADARARGDAGPGFELRLVRVLRIGAAVVRAHGPGRRGGGREGDAGRRGRPRVASCGAPVPARRARPGGRRRSPAGAAACPPPRSRRCGGRSPRRHGPRSGCPRTTRRGSPREPLRSSCAATARARSRRSTARAAGGLGVGAQRRPDAGDLVGGDRRAGAGPAAHDALVRAALGHVAGGGLAGPGPVVALAGRERAVQQRLVTAAAQLVHHGLGHARALVGGHRDPHPRAA